MNNETHSSYVEVMIIAIVLGVAAKMIAPQFTEASNEEAEVCGLIDGLEKMRVHLDLYQVRHQGCLPPTDSFAGFESAVTTIAGRYVPYIKEIPTNPFNGLKTVRFDGEPAGAGKAGWRLDTETGLFQADNDANYAAL